MGEGVRIKMMQQLFTILNSKYGFYVGFSYGLAISSMSYIAYLVYKQKRLTRLFLKQFYE